MEQNFLERCAFTRATQAHADKIDALYHAVKKIGRENGTTDWDDDYPNRDFIDEDIENGFSFVLCLEGEVLAAVSMLPEDDLDDCCIEWTPKKACVLAQLCVKPALQGMHVGEYVMHLVSEEAKRMGYEATRHLAAAANPASLRLYERMGYKMLGSVHLYDTDFYAYERIFEE